MYFNSKEEKDGRSVDRKRVLGGKVNYSNSRKQLVSIKKEV